jgi:CyaY protein
MNESHFHQIVDSTLMQVEAILDTANSDLDYVASNGMLAINCINGSQIIFSRQPALSQLWLACQAGGFHFDYGQDYWLLDKNAKLSLGQILNQAIQAQAGETLDCSALG